MHREGNVFMETSGDPRMDGLLQNRHGIPRMSSEHHKASLVISSLKHLYKFDFMKTAKLLLRRIKKESLVI